MSKPTPADLRRTASQRERAMLQAFNAIVADIKNQAVLSEIVRALEVGNVDGVITLLNLDAPTWEPLAEQIRESYRTGGITGAAQLGKIPVAGVAVAARFDMRNIRAEQWVATHSSRLITEIVAEQRTNIRALLTDAVARGQGPRTTALDLVGRIDPRTRQRVGGIVGLTENQAGWVRNARAELESLDPAYLGRKLRDPRFDAAVRRAIADGKPLPAAQIDRAITQMQARAQRYRGEVIARTESIDALRAGQFESIQQAVGVGEIDARDVTKTWDSTGDGKTRPEHSAADGQSVPVDQPFTVGGELLMYPGDTSRGASARNTIQCRCTVAYGVDYLGRAARIEGFG